MEATSQKPLYLARPVTQVQALGGRSHELMAAGTESPMQRGHHVVPMETLWLRERLFRCWPSQQLVSLPGRDIKATQVSASIWRNLFAATISKSTATAAPAPVVKYIQPAPTIQTAPATFTRHEQGRHSGLLQQPQVDHGAPVLYGAPTNFDSTMTVFAISGAVNCAS